MKRQTKEADKLILEHIKLLHNKLILKLSVQTIKPQEILQQQDELVMIRFLQGLPTTIQELTQQINQRLCSCDSVCGTLNPEESQQSAVPDCWKIQQVYMEDPCGDQIQLQNQVDLACMYRLALVAEQRILKITVLAFKNTIELDTEKKEQIEIEIQEEKKHAVQEKPTLITAENMPTNWPAHVENEGFRFIIHSQFKGFFYYKCEDSKDKSCKGCYRLEEAEKDKAGVLCRPHSVMPSEHRSQEHLKEQLEKVKDKLQTDYKKILTLDNKIFGRDVRIYKTSKGSSFASVLLVSDTEVKTLKSNQNNKNHSIVIENQKSQKSTLLNLYLFDHISSQFMPICHSIILQLDESEEINEDQEQLKEVVQNTLKFIKNYMGKAYLKPTLIQIASMSETGALSLSQASQIVFPEASVSISTLSFLIFIYLRFKDKDLFDLLKTTVLVSQDESMKHIQHKDKAFQTEVQDAFLYHKSLYNQFQVVNQNLPLYISIIRLHEQIINIQLSHALSNEDKDQNLFVSMAQYIEQFKAQEQASKQLDHLCLDKYNNTGIYQDQVITPWLDDLLVHHQHTSQILNPGPDSTFETIQTLIDRVNAGSQALIARMSPEDAASRRDRTNQLEKTVLKVAVNKIQ